jgi:hypothetical protein
MHIHLHLLYWTKLIGFSTYEINKQNGSPIVTVAAHRLCRNYEVLIKLDLCDEGSDYNELHNLL